MTARGHGRQQRRRRAELQPNYVRCSPALTHHAHSSLISCMVHRPVCNPCCGPAVRARIPHQTSQAVTLAHASGSSAQTTWDWRRGPTPATPARGRTTAWSSASSTSRPSERRCVFCFTHATTQLYHKFPASCPAAQGQGQPRAATRAPYRSFCSSATSGSAGQEPMTARG